MMNKAETPSAPAARTDERMFEIEGRISNLYVTDGTQNLLEGMRGKMALTGTAAVLNDMAGSVATASMMAMYGGEDVQHFGCHVGDQMVIGTFETADFNDGEDVFVVASRLDDQALFAHAVLRASDGALWMPRAIAKGRWKVAKWLAIACSLIILIASIVDTLLYLFRSSAAGYLDDMLGLLATLVGLSLVLGGAVFRSSLPDARYAEKIFKVLGLKNPKSVNLSPYSMARLYEGGSYMTYDFEAVIEAHGTASETPEEARLRVVQAAPKIAARKAERERVRNMILRRTATKSTPQK